MPSSLENKNVSMCNSLQFTLPGNIHILLSFELVFCTLNSELYQVIQS